MSDYKINPESIPENTTVYKKVELTDKHVISESTKTLEDLLMESYKHALREGIKANTVILDENFCKVNGFDFLIGNNGMGYRRLPPMICGMEIRGVSKGELPEGYNFAVFEATMTEREALIRDTVRGMYSLLKHEFSAFMRISDVDNEVPMISGNDILDLLSRVRDIMLKEDQSNDSPTDESSGS